MGKIMVESWVLDENDKAQIKQYKNQIALRFKIANFSLKSTDNSREFFNVFRLESFDFIPCIKEGLGFDDFWDYSSEIELAIIQAVENENIVSAFSAFSADEIINALEEMNDTPARKVIGSIIFQNDLEGDVTDWILDNCDEKTKVEFLDWILKQQD